MKKQLLFSAIIAPFLLLNTVSAQNVGVGEHHPGSRLSVKGGLAIGGDYSTIASPPSGAIIQGPVGIGTSNPDPNALMDFQSTSKGVLLPRLTAEQRNAIQSPATGLLVFDTDSNSFYYYNGNDAAWAKMVSSGSKSVPAKGETGVITPSTNPKWVFPGTEIEVAGGVTYNNININDATHVNLVENTGSGSFVVSGITGGIDGQMIILENDYNNSGAMIISSSNANATGGIRLQNKEKGSQLSVVAGKSITLIYDGKKGTWKVVNWQHE